MFKKFLSLLLAFIMLFSSNLYAGGDIPAEEIKLMLSATEKYSKEDGMLLSMAVMAGLPKYDALIKNVMELKENLLSKELLLEEMQNKRILQAGKDMWVPMNKSKDFKMNFPAFDHHYKWQKANIYAPALEEVQKHRLAYIEFYKSPEVRQRWEAAEKAFAATEKEFKALERQWTSARNNLLKTSTVSTEEAALKKEIASLRKSLTSKQKSFAEAQTRVFMEEYSTLVNKLRAKAGFFMPKELDNFIRSLETSLYHFHHASTDEDINFARKTIKNVLEKFRNIKPGVGPKEVKYYRESLNEFFSKMSKRLNLKSSLPLLAAGSIMMFMFSAQSAQSAEISNKNVIIARTLEYSYNETPELMLANALSLSKYYGLEAVGNILYERQKYMPLIEKQLGVLKYIGENSAKEQDLVSDIVISSHDYSIPVKGFSF